MFSIMVPIIIRTQTAYAYIVSGLSRHQNKNVVVPLNIKAKGTDIFGEYMSHNLPTTGKTNADSITEYIIMFM